MQLILIADIFCIATMTDKVCANYAFKTCFKTCLDLDQDGNKPSFVITKTIIVHPNLG